jgi:RES domain-containing protein
LEHARSSDYLFRGDLIRCLEFPQEIISEVNIADLPKDWRSSPPPPELGKIGDRWCRENRSAVLRVPNAMVPLEVNFLVNPAHADFSPVEIQGPIDFAADDRLV